MLNFCSGEVLLDQERYQDAIEKFERAIELERNKWVAMPSGSGSFMFLHAILNRPPPMNVLPLVNKSLALFQWKKDGASAEQFCLEALQCDPLCEAAFATLGQIYLAQQDFDKALERFRDLTKISSNAPQLALTFYHIYVSADPALVGEYVADILHSPPKPKSSSCGTIHLMPRVSHKNSLVRLVASTIRHDYLQHMLHQRVY